MYCRNELLPEIVSGVVRKNVYFSSLYGLYSEVLQFC